MRQVVRNRRVAYDNCGTSHHDSTDNGSRLVVRNRAVGYCYLRHVGVEHCSATEATIGINADCAIARDRRVAYRHIIVRTTPNIDTAASPYPSLRARRYRSV